MLLTPADTVPNLEKRERSIPVSQLTRLRRESLLWGAPVRDAHYNLLRFIELPDLGVDDSWDGYGIRPFAAGEMPKIAEHPVSQRIGLRGHFGESTRPS
jgi:hypothetical protein